MRISIIVAIVILLFCQNIFAKSNCKQTLYNNIAICLDDTYITEVQEENIIIKEKVSIDQGYVVIGMSPGKNYDENVQRACRESNDIQCISSGVCGNMSFRGKSLTYIDKKYQNGIINISCLIEDANVVIIYHGSSAYSDLFDKILSRTSLQIK